MKRIFKIKLTILLLLLFRLCYGQLPDIVAMEYFFDVDPGYGNAISVPITADSLIDVNFNANLTGVSSGFHILYVRIKDDLGKWSIVLTQGFSKFPEPIAISSPDILPQLTHMEYFFDTDPGFGNGVEVPVTSDSLVDVAFNADLSSVFSGFHILYVRLKDEYGNWSIVLSEGFLKFPEPIAVATPGDLPQITHMEYFFDADPGFGNGVNVPITSDSIIEVLFDADLSSLDIGLHTLLIRVKDENANWSLLHTYNLFVFSPPTPGVLEPLPNIVAMEYFIDNDPGFGNGTAILNVPDSLIVENFWANISALEPGKHLIFSRVKDENNRWSISVVKEFCLSGLLVFLEGPYESATGLMSTSLNDQDLIPLEQPFDTDPAAVWYYEGAETVSSIPNTLIVDWLLLQARDAISPVDATSATIKENQVAFLLNTGNIVGLDGESPISFTQPIENDLYLVVYHRNHLGIMSSFPLDISGECEISYNFSKDLVQVYGSENGHKEISSGLWGMISGDGNGNGQITVEDITVWSGVAGISEYQGSDLNMDGNVDNKDKNDSWNINLADESQVPD